MTGQSVEAHFPKPPALHEARPLLEARGLSGPGLADVSLALGAGEILGIGGLAGHGHRELFFSLFGAQPTTGGEILVAGKRARVKSPRDAARLGVALVPEDRKTEGLLLPMSVLTNLTLAVLGRISSAGILRRGRERGLAFGMIDALKIRTPSVNNPVGRLSGGNQQKVLLASRMAASPQLLILQEPTRGVDVGARVEIHRFLVDIARQGCAVLLVTSDVEESVVVSDRLIVLRDGAIVGELSGDSKTQETAIALAAGKAA